VLIDGYYDDVIPLSAAEKKALSDIEDPAPVLKQELGFAEAEMLGVSFLESITSIPTLNINGISAANTGRLASNVIPTTASAALDLRLVKGNTVENQVRRVKDHIRKMGFYIVDKEPTDEERAKYKDIIFVTQGHGYPAQRTPIDHPLAMKVASAVQSSTDKKIILMPSSGGSLPLYLFDKVTKTYPVTIPVVNYDNNQHAENENLELGRLKEGIKTIGAVMMGL
jgi:acetylornithine deacetylase/succinyl-diaminopimelate desuccinylase-like protein